MTIATTSLLMRAVCAMTICGFAATARFVPMSPERRRRLIRIGFVSAMIYALVMLLIVVIHLVSFL